MHAVVVFATFGGQARVVEHVVLVVSHFVVLTVLYGAEKFVLRSKFFEVVLVKVRHHTFCRLLHKGSVTFVLLPVRVV